MSYIMNFEEKDDFLKVEITGTRTRRNELVDAIEVLSNVNEIGKAKNINKILLILRITGPLPSMVSYDIGNKAEELGWSRMFSVAAVTMDEYSMKSYLFIETVAVNRGYNVKIFDNEQDAKIWLLSS
jgi:hypothetical protein